MKQNNLALELKDAGDENDPATIVTKALAGFQTALDHRLKPIETKSGDDTKLKARLDAMEAKLNRPGAGLNADNDNDSKLETKTFTSYVRSGREAMDQLEVKTFIVANDAGGGYLAPAQLSTEMIRLLTLFSPVRAAAYVDQTGSPSIILPKRTGTRSGKAKSKTRKSRNPRSANPKFRCSA
jgi:HK97 family phage major capsid protein